jgi:hypothetical protein
MEFSNETVYFLIGVFIVATVLIYNVKKEKKEITLQSDIQTMDTLLIEIDKLRNKIENLEIKFKVEVENNIRTSKGLQRSLGLTGDTIRDNENLTSRLVD